MSRKLPEDDLLPVPFGEAPADRARSVGSAMAQVLRDHVEAMGWPVHRKARWDSAFTMLVKKYGEPAVRARLKSYIHYKIDHPKVQSGDDFRNNWDWIGEAVTRAELRARPDTLPEGAKEVLAEVTLWDWPQKAIEQLPAVVKQSILNLESFRSVLKEKGDAGRVLLWELSDPVTVLTTHFKLLYKKYGQWTAWSGELGGHVWAPTHPLSARTLKAVLVQWAGSDDGSWDEVVEAKGK